MCLFNTSSIKCMKENAGKTEFNPTKLHGPVVVSEQIFRRSNSCHHTFLYRTKWLNFINKQKINYWNSDLPIWTLSVAFLKNPHKHRDGAKWSLWRSSLMPVCLMFNEQWHSTYLAAVILAFNTAVSLSVTEAFSVRVPAI